MAPDGRQHRDEQTQRALDSKADSCVVPQQSIKHYDLPLLAHLIRLVTQPKQAAGTATVLCNHHSYICHAGITEHVSGLSRVQISNQISF